MTSDLYLHALRQHLEWRRGRALPVRMDTLARHLGDARGRSDEASIRRRLGQVGITMRLPAIAGTRGTNRAHLALVPEPARASNTASTDPLGHAVAATIVLATDVDDDVRRAPVDAVLRDPHGRGRLDGRTGRGPLPPEILGHHQAAGARREVGPAAR